MSLRLKRWLAGGLLAVAAIWPLVHFGLVRGLEVSPWKLGGFAMYSEPVPPVLVVILEPGEQALVPVDPRSLPPPAARALLEFQKDRHALGALVEPEALGRAVLAARPDLPAVVIALQRLRLGPDARMVSTREQFLYDRAGLE